MWLDRDESAAPKLRRGGEGLVVRAASGLVKRRRLCGKEKPCSLSGGEAMVEGGLMSSLEKVAEVGVDSTVSASSKADGSWPEVHVDSWRFEESCCLCGPDVSGNAAGQCGC